MEKATAYALAEYILASSKGQTMNSPDPDHVFCDTLRNLRESGWSVAVHNDYKRDGEMFTFWLFTHPSGKWIKGEGKTDLEAVQEAESQINKYLHPFYEDLLKKNKNEKI